ncbi:MAG: MFS transporter, partial [Bdellovibrionales bacterium]|nr:MFS transporter [Bdellovibrionales bacterium]
VFFALLGFTTSFGMYYIPPSGARSRFALNPFRDAWRSVKEVREHRGLFLTMIATCYFWFLGSLFQLNTLLYADQVLGLNDLQTGLLLTVLAFGIGLGSIGAGVVSEGKVELGLVPLGAVGISFFSMLLLVTTESFISASSALLLLGICSGFYIVPLNAYFQLESPETKRGRFIAAVNVVSFSGMLLSALLFTLLSDVLHLGADKIFFVLGLLSIGASVYIVKMLPEMLVRCINWILTHTVYRLTVLGHQNVPRSGGALLVCNHVSFADPPLLLASVTRPIRFLMFRPLYEAKLFHPIARIMGAIPVSGSDARDEKFRSLETARECIRQGELVCIFAEGGISRTGQLLPFKGGLERIMRDNLDAPIIPVYIDQIWGSIFSFSNGKFLWKWPRKIPYSVTILFGEPLAPDTSARNVRSAVQELSTEAFQRRAAARRVVTRSMLRRLARQRWKIAVADSQGTVLRRWQFLARALALRSVLLHLHPDERRIGMLLPPSAHTAVLNAAVLLAGKTPVNLNYTASQEAL